jgi:hypothetical protein
LEAAVEASAAVVFSNPASAGLAEMPLVGFGYRTTLVIGEGFSPLRQQIWDFGNI